MPDKSSFSDKVFLNPLIIWAFGLIAGVLLAISSRPHSATYVEVYTDATTGCQYLYRPYHGGITPRLDSHGQQLCTLKTAGH